MDDLIKNVKEFWNSAELVYSAKDYTSATILYFKCLFVALDVVILKGLKMTPKDHSERFRILKESFPELYTVLDKIYPIYRDTYSIRIEKEKCDEVKEHVRKIAEEQKIQLSDN